MLTLRTKLFYLEKTKRQKDCNDMEKILIVEDDITFGTMIQTWLKKKGFEVEKTTSVKAAIQAWEKVENGFDLVLSDLRLPDHDGIFLLQ